MEIGLKKVGTETVIQEKTAAFLASGTLPVYATPAMILLIERTAAESVAPFLEEGWTTVGTRLDVQHLSATPIGMTIRCESELIEIDRKRLAFQVQVFDDAGLIGTGTHERFVVLGEKFMAKARAKQKE